MASGEQSVEGVSVGLGEDWPIVESLLPSGWQEQARHLGAFRRARGFEDARALLRVLLIHLAEGCGLRQSVARARLAGLAEVSDVALLKRLKSAGPWFEWLAQGLREAVLPPASGSATRDEGLPRLAGRRLRVVDGSVVREPGPTGSLWRVHYAIGLPDLQAQEVHLGPQDEGETLKRFEVQAGDVFMADRGYAHPGGIAHVKAGGGDVIVRLNLVTVPLYGPTAEDTARWDLLAHARTLGPGQVGRWPVSVRPKATSAKADRILIQGHLCAVRKSALAAAQARERVRRESLRGQATLQPQTLEAADYVFVFTTLPETVTAAQVLAIYRLRWQIELTFKRLKSLLDLGHLKKHDPQAARSWLQGKLVVAFLVARLIAHAERFSPWGYDLDAVSPTPAPLPLA